jgi:hypothetical protein
VKTELDKDVRHGNPREKKNEKSRREGNPVRIRE